MKSQNALTLYWSKKIARKLSVLPAVALATAIVSGCTPNLHANSSSWDFDLRWSISTQPTTNHTKKSIDDIISASNAVTSYSASRWIDQVIASTAGTKIWAQMIGQYNMCQGHHPEHYICQDSYITTWNTISYDEHIENILKINYDVNTRFNQITDDQIHNMSEFWNDLVLGKEKVSWDCEDLMMAKMTILMDKYNIPANQMRMVVVRQDNNNNAWHMLLAISTDKWIIISDNIDNELYLITDLKGGLKNLWYTLLKIQSQKWPKHWTDFA